MSPGLFFATTSHSTPERNALLTPTGNDSTHTECGENYFRADVRTLSQTLSNYDWTRSFNTGKVDSG